MKVVWPILAGLMYAAGIAEAILDTCLFAKQRWIANNATDFVFKLGRYLYGNFTLERWYNPLNMH